MMVLVQHVGVVLPVWLGDDGSGAAGGGGAIPVWLGDDGSGAAGGGGGAAGVVLMVEHGEHEHEDLDTKMAID